jgi:hypothetical protein
MTVRSLLAIVFAMGLQPLCAAAQPVRERVSVGVIRISITAQSSGEPVRDLAPEELFPAGGWSSRSHRLPGGLRPSDEPGSALVARKQEAQERGWEVE